MPRRPRKGFDPEIRFHGLGGSLVHRGLFTNREVALILSTAQRTQGPPGVWDRALNNLITEANMRLANRGKNQYNTSTKHGEG